MKIETREGLWVSDTFTEKFGTKSITPSTSVPGYKILPKNMTDAEIKKTLGVQECALEDVAAFLQNPPQCMNDGYTNLFYVAGYVVLVHWYSGCREWGVNAWGLDGGHWGAGCRAFSCNWHSDTKPSALSPSDTLSLPKNDALYISKLESRIAHLEAWQERMRVALVGLGE